MRIYYLLVILLFQATACCDDDIMPTRQTAGIIRFSNPEVGQRSKYLGFDGEMYGVQSGYLEFRYKPDTLILEIFRKTEDKYQLAEYWAPGSENIAQTDTIYHWFRIDQDSLYLEHTMDEFAWSYFFTAYGLDQWQNDDSMAIALYATDSVFANIEGWQMDIPYSESYRMYKINEWILFDQNYINLNAVVNNTPMQLDGDGTTYIYADSTGFVRSVSYSWWTRMGSGWDLLPTN